VASNCFAWTVYLVSVWIVFFPVFIFLFFFFFFAMTALPPFPENATFCIREGTVEEAGQIGLVINTAFVEADAWFKKPEHHFRFDQKGDRMRQFISDEHSTVLVAETEGDEKILVGAVTLDWKGGVGHWGALACPKVYGRRGVGKGLVTAAIGFFRSNPQTTKIEIIVVATKNERLVAWYEKLGLVQTGG
jgi:hypothetical protein